MSALVLARRAGVIDEQLVAAILRGEPVRAQKAGGTCRNPACGQALRRRPEGGCTGACGYCAGCYLRWLRAGRPDSGPPSRKRRGGSTAGAARARQEAARARAEDYAEIRSWGASRADAAERVGVCAYGPASAKYERAYQASRLEVAA